MAIFDVTGNLVPSYSSFDLSHDFTFNCDMGQCVPILRLNCMPGGHYKISNGVLAQFQPLVAPVKHSIKLYVHYFFVPYRLVFDDWVEFITGGKDNDTTKELPTWYDVQADAQGNQPWHTKFSVWDYFGYPLFTPETFDTSMMENKDMPTALDLRAYNLIYNEWYRDENIQDERDLMDWTIFCRDWRKDYFTSALPFQQRGIAPRIPLGAAGAGNVVIPLTVLNQLVDPDPEDPIEDTYFKSEVGSITMPYNEDAEYVNPVGYAFQQNDGDGNASSPSLPFGHFPLRSSSEYFQDYTQTIGVDPNTLMQYGLSISPSDLRLAMQLQKWQERNARCGVRYVEFIKAHYNTVLPDSTAQRPVLLGGTVQDIVVSSVSQTSNTNEVSPLGTLAGDASSAAYGDVTDFKALEYGVLLGIMSIMPKASYSQGVNKMWMKHSRYDFYFPEFAALSEQPITRGELYFSSIPEDNNVIFGYNGAWDEYRVMQDYIAGDLRDILDTWTLSRKFDNAPALNDDFLKMDGTRPDMKRIFAVQDEPGIICYFHNNIEAVLPMPYISEPGLVDHF